MSKLQVFDPAMCCSTGVCGLVVDPVLPRFSADLDWLKSQGVAVERFNLAQQPQAFVENEAVKQAMKEDGTECLPLILVDGRIVSRGTYPDRIELAALLGLPSPQGSVYSSVVAELVAIGASIAANCMPCFDYHFNKARQLGLSEEDIACAVKTGLAVKQASGRAVLGVAERHLRRTFTGESSKVAVDQVNQGQGLFPMVDFEPGCDPASNCC